MNGCTPEPLPTVHRGNKLNHEILIGEFFGLPSCRQQYSALYRLHNHSIIASSLFELEEICIKIIRVIVDSYYPPE